MDRFFSILKTVLIVLNNIVFGILALFTFFFTVFWPKHGHEYEYEGTKFYQEVDTYAIRDGLLLPMIILLILSLMGVGRRYWWIYFIITIIIFLCWLFKWAM